MPHQLISLSPDLKHLRDDGYEIETIDAYLIVHHIPYVNTQKEVKLGKIIVPLSINGGIVKYAGNHVIYFMGEYPCYKDGSPIEGIRHCHPNQRLNSDFIMNFSFSNKPTNGYKDHYEQITRYIDIISGPAMSIDTTISPKTNRIIEDTSSDNVFQYLDTNESRANIINLNNKFRGQKIAIIGLGGTGSYILDLVSKSPISEIHLYDGDVYSQHNAFRSPGAASKEDIDKEMPKVEYFKNIYSNIHKNIYAHYEYIEDKNFQDFDKMSYIFICIDNSDIKEELIKYFITKDKTFFDVGLGTNVVNDSLIGTIRLTTGSPIKYDHLQKRIPVDDKKVNNEYSTNIQIADLNAMNAVLAVIKWKKICGFYQDLEQEFYTTYTINDSELLNEDKAINP